MDLFEQYQEQPNDLAAICKIYEQKLEDGTGDAYEICKEFLSKVEGIGYTL